jgi:NitT/TauT family transport system ATP-binding protein
MDEPLSALDAQTRELLMDDLIGLHVVDAPSRGEAIGTVYVTHNLEEAVRLADRIVVLSRRPGRVKAVVPIARPRERSPDDAGVARDAQHLWGLIRADAEAADRELADA